MDVAVDSVTITDPGPSIEPQDEQQTGPTPPNPSATDSRSPLTMVIPASYRQPVVSLAAWSVWYGSQKAVADVADTLMRLRNPKLNAVRALATMNAPRGRGIPSTSVVLSFLGIAEHRKIVREVMGDGFDRIDLPSRLDVNLGQLLGNDVRDNLRHKVQTLPVGELARSIEQGFPILGSLVQAGAFHRDMALPLLYLSALNNRLIETGSKLSQPERHRIEMAVTVLCTELPPRVPGLIFGTCEFLLKLFPEHSAKELELITKRGAIEAGVPLYDQMSEGGFALLVKDILDHHRSAKPKTKHRMPQLLEAAEASALSLRSGPNALTIVYTQFCDEFAIERWETLTEALQKHAEAMELAFDHRAFPRDLVGRPIEHFKGQPGEAIQTLRTLIASTYSLLDPAAFTARADKQLAKARELEAQITGLGSHLTASALMKIANLAQACSAEILNNRGWFKQELEGFTPLVRAWMRFYEDWDRLTRQKVPMTQSKPAAALSVVERLPVAPAVMSPDVQELQNKLANAQALLQARDAEFADMRSELYVLRTFKESLSIPIHRPDPLAVNLDLMRRIAVRETLTPTDVLLFVEAIGDGRVVILESAWKSAKEAATFQHCTRMLDVITTMAFPYYDSLMDGNPDATARALLGNAYSANESETVSSQRRLRSMREFEYQGQTHFFERHLKAGNGMGLDGMRIHFDILDGKVVIAYAGPHLECASSN